MGRATTKGILHHESILSLASTHHAFISQEVFGLSLELAALHSEFLSPQLCGSSSL